jgi:mono/diheme cytochrome c family protein
VGQKEGEPSEPGLDLTFIKAGNLELASYWRWMARPATWKRRSSPMRFLLLSLAIAVSAVASAFAAEEVGDPQAGFEYAKNVCSACHGISAERSPMKKATRFREVADRPGVTGTALRVWMETSHPTMPNIIIEKQDMLNVIAYILSLKGRDADPR